jgi:hypothetical protein
LAEKAKNVVNLNRPTRLSVSLRGRKGGSARAIAVAALAFLCLALVVALLIAPYLQSRGFGSFASIFLGSAVAAYGAWFLIYAAYKVSRRGRRL